MGLGPNVFVVAGPNGAGKTTFATEFLPGYVNCREFLNADLIAAGLAPFAPESANILAGRLLLQRIAELTVAKRDFGFETTLAGRSYLGILQRMKQAGYRVHLFFLWLPTVELALSRVATRVLQGGHHVSEGDVRRRYHSGIRNFVRLYRHVAAQWWLYDGSKSPPTLIAEAENGTRSVRAPDLLMQIESFAHAEK